MVPTLHDDLRHDRRGEGEESAVPTSTTINDAIEVRSRRYPRCTTINEDEERGGAGGPTMHDTIDEDEGRGGAGGAPMHDNRRRGEEVPAVLTMHDD